MSSYVYADPESVDRHLDKHNRERPIEDLERKIYCTLCYPPPSEISLEFFNFWHWLKDNHHAEQYTSYTVQSYQLLITNLRSDNSNFIYDLIAKVVSSVSYTQSGLTLRELILSAYQDQIFPYFRNDTDLESTDEEPESEPEEINNQPISQPNSPVNITNTPTPNPSPPPSPPPVVPVQPPNNFNNMAAPTAAATNNIVPRYLWSRGS